MQNDVQTIVFCSTSYAYYDRRMQRIIKHLKKKNDVIWYSRVHTPGFLMSDFNNREIHCFFKRGPLFYLEFNLRLFINLMTEKYDIISSVDLDSLLACFLASRFRKRRLIFDAHEIFHEVPELEGKPIRRWVWKSLSKFLFNKPDAKYTVNKSLADVFKHQFNSDFGIVRNVPELNHLEGIPQRSSMTLCYLGVVNKGRGLDVILHSMQKLKEYKLMVIGGGDLLKETEQLASQLKIENRVEFKGFVDPSDIPKLLSECSIGLNILDPNSDNYKFSLANKFFDYIHACLPSINMNFEEYRNINKRHQVSILIDEYSSDQLIKAVRLLENDSTYNTLRANCKSAREIYNWKSESAKLSEYYS